MGIYGAPTQYRSHNAEGVFENIYQTENKNCVKHVLFYEFWLFVRSSFGARHGCRNCSGPSLSPGTTHDTFTNENKLKHTHTH